MMLVTSVVYTGPSETTTRSNYGFWFRLYWAFAILFPINIRGQSALPESLSFDVVGCYTLPYCCIEYGA